MSIVVVSDINSDTLLLDKCAHVEVDLFIPESNIAQEGIAAFTSAANKSIRLSEDETRMNKDHAWVS